MLHCLLARSANPTLERLVCSSWPAAKPGFPELLSEIKPLYLPSCFTSLHLREGWSVKQSTRRGFNHTDATVPHYLVGLFPQKALLKPYLPVLHVFVRVQQLSSAFCILHSSSWSVSGVDSAVWEVQQRQGQKTPSIWVQGLHRSEFQHIRFGLWRLVPKGNWPGDFSEWLSLIMLHPKWVAELLCCMTFLQSKPSPASSGSS